MFIKFFPTIPIDGGGGGQSLAAKKKFPQDCNFFIFYFKIQDCNSFSSRMILKYNC